MNDIWATLKQGGNTYHRYEISESGLVWDVENEVMVSQVLTGKPQYYYVNLTTPEGRILRRVHNCVAWTFLGEPPTPKHSADHIDQDKFNNHVSNIRWANKRIQMTNRGNTKLMADGQPVVEFIESLGCDWNEGRGKYLYKKLCEGYSYSDACFDWAKTLQPALRKLNKKYSESVEYEGVWYPSTELFCKEKANCSARTFLARINEGCNIEDALTSTNLGNIRTIDGFTMNQLGHCNRLFLSEPKINSKMSKLGLSFEEAIKLPVERVLKHAINGDIKRNADWCEHFGITSPRTFNAYLSKKTSKGKRTFRQALEHFKVDTSGMEIYPCDGDIIMKNRPL